jgi:hypothetical protein
LTSPDVAYTDTDGPRLQGLDRFLSVTGLVTPRGSGALTLGRASASGEQRRAKIAPSAKCRLFVPRGPLAIVEKHCAKHTENANIQAEVVATALGQRVAAHVGHWTTNPACFEFMKTMRQPMVVPKLQPRFTAFHGTRVPILIVFHLRATDIARLSLTGHFWRRCVDDTAVSRGLYCRDYTVEICTPRSRCVWRTLHGNAGATLCLYHLGESPSSEYHAMCKRITSIPGRSREELLQHYHDWTEAKKKALEARRKFVETQDAQFAVQSAHAEGTGDENRLAESQVSHEVDGTTLRPLKPARPFCGSGLAGNRPLRLVQAPAPLRDARAHASEHRRVRV